MKAEEWVAIGLISAAVVVLIVGLVWPTPPTGSCGNDLKPPPGAPHSKVYTLFASGLIGGAAAMAGILLPGIDRRWRWCLFLTGTVITVVGLGGALAYSFPPCGLY
jgi:hypothetical protein